ncbi:MAG: gliding motility-associated-like protein/CSLREA domain-containing protein [Flavobacteriales bacterium]|jgi:gliding motility-associated-like protein/CSLREA domain-containing protein
MLRSLVSLKSLMLWAIVMLSLNSLAQYNVDTIADTPDANPGDGVCADAGGNCSLRAAVMEANATVAANTINLPIGEYVFTVGGMYENAAATGDLDISADLTITGADTRQTIIRADSLDRVFDILGTVVATIQNLEIWEGDVFAGSGGAIQNLGELTLNEVGIKSSMCEGDDGGLQGGGFGGAIYNDGTLTLNQVTINNCLALGGKGGNGVAPGGGSGAGAGPGFGGAIYNDLNSSCTINNSTFSSNTAQGGRGGNGTFHQGSGTTQSPGGAGGGFGGNAGPNNGAGSAGNWAGGGGGGGSISGAGAVGGFGGGGGGGGASSWGGAAGPGGASGLYGGAGGQGCCSAGSGGGGGAGLGGAIFNRSIDFFMTNCTLAFNEAIGGNGGGGWFSGGGAAGEGHGGGMFNLDGFATINNSLLAQNGGTTSGASAFGSFSSDAGHNFFQTTDGTLTLVGTLDNNILNEDPLILPLANNGGNTDTHLLESCDPISPAIDAGNDAFASATDQIGQPRMNVSEIGALEILASSVTLLPADTALCVGQSVLLDVTSDDSTYEWDDSSIESTLLVDQEGLYSVTISQGGCNYSDEIQIDFNPLESIDLGPDQVICPNSFIVLDASYPGATYVWQDNSTAPIFDALDAGTYDVIVTLDNCSASDEVVVSIVDAVELNLGADVSICEGETTELSTDVIADTYEWSTTEEVPLIEVGNAGDYTLVVTIDGCVFSESIEVFVDENPSFSLGPDTELCDGETITLDVSNEIGTYTWQDGSTNATFPVFAEGNYSVTVTLGNCTGSDEIIVSYFPIPVFELGADVIVCYSSGFQLEVITDVPDVTILWNTGQLSSTITPQTTGNYQATVSADGCGHVDDVEVEIIDQLYMDLGEDRLVCKGNTLSIQTDIYGFNYPLTYSWTDGSNLPTLGVTETGTYSVTVESECDTRTDEIDVYFEQCGCLLYVPNAFTPDNDGVNEFFSVTSECSFDSYQLQIFNRNGEVVFSSVEPDAVWDGAHQSGDHYVPDGVYVYRIEYSSTTLEGLVVEVVSGHVSIIR